MYMRSSMQSNMTFHLWQGLFGHYELQNPEGFYLMKENAVFESEDLVKECCSPHRSRKIVEVRQ